MTGGHEGHVGFQHRCMYFLKRATEREVIVLECLHMGTFAASVPAVQRKKEHDQHGWGFMKWDINFKFLSLLFINSLLCAFSGLM